MSTKPPTTASTNGKRAPATSDSEVGGVCGPPGVSAPIVAPNNPEETNGKKPNGTLLTRTSTSAKTGSGVNSVPAKAIVRKSSKVSGSNPLLVARKYPGGGQATKPAGGGKTPGNNSQKQKNQLETRSSGRSIQTDGVGGQDGPSSQSNGYVEILNDTLPMPNNLEALHLHNGNGPSSVGINLERFVVEVSVNGAGTSNGNGGRMDDDPHQNSSTAGIAGDSILTNSPNLSNNNNDAFQFFTPIENNSDASVSGLMSTNSSKIPFVSPHLKFCNRNCSKLHFCIQNIPTPEELIPLNQSMMQPRAPHSSLSSEKSTKCVNGYGLNGDTCIIDKSPLPVPGIQEALDNLHGLRNFAVCYGLMNTMGRYQGFAEIEAMILEKVQQMQIQQRSSVTIINK